MVKFLKYCLSLVALVLLMSCGKDAETLSSEERVALAKKMYDPIGYYGQGTPKVMSMLDSIVALNPEHCDAVRELSVAYLKRGLMLPWKVQFDKAVECDPKIWVPWRGYLYLQFYRDYEKAIADFNASDTLTPNFTDAPQGQSVDYWRGLAYLGLKDYENSIKYLDHYIDEVTAENGEDWAEPTAFLYRGIAHYENKNPEAALLDFNKMIVYNKNRTADGSYYKALILFEANKCEEAKNELDIAIANFNNGYYNNDVYTEALKQIYIQDLNNLEAALKTQCQNKNETY
ncbi:hypothetical protein AEQU2_00010 [Aequorivita lipolytica]|uniref:Tetratricopeptide repeat protein n=2 Tax=Aequorivita lipolytica TaxID=153267 RepID=A0A5C6YT21_9FLAO|nr:hypothetical protein ESV24_00055 [Aequorivita lipolytica]SRX49549.1 hypothetical protein AEQU2_00010 [Aequorivita lipolytica]